MKTANYTMAILLAIGTGAAQAETPATLIAGYTAEAARATPGFTSSAERGQVLFTRKWGVSQTMPSCATCHSDQPTAEGRHVVTSKRIAPLSPAANPETLQQFGQGREMVPAQLPGGGRARVQRRGKSRFHSICQ